MSSVTALTKREPVPVKMGALILYCEGFKASGVRAVAEESSVDGAAVITNNAARSTRLTFSGRVCTDGRPMDFVIAANGMIHSAMTFVTEYMGLIFSECRLISYSFEDKGGEAALASVTLLSTGIIEESDKR